MLPPAWAYSTSLRKSGTGSCILLWLENVDIPEFLISYRRKCTGRAGGSDMKINLMQRCIAELIGTFALVFIGCTTRAMVGDTTNFAGILVVHLSFALTIAAM